MKDYIVRSTLEYNFSPEKVSINSEIMPIISESNSVFCVKNQSNREETIFDTDFEEYYYEDFGNMITITTYVKNGNMAEVERNLKQASVDKLNIMANNLLAAAHYVSMYVERKKE